VAATMAPAQQPAGPAKRAPGPAADLPSKPAGVPTIDVESYILDNITRFDGPPTFLAGPTERTKHLMEQVQVCQGAELEHLLRWWGASNAGAHASYCQAAVVLKRTHKRTSYCEAAGGAWLDSKTTSAPAAQMIAKERGAGAYYNWHFISAARRSRLPLPQALCKEERKKGIMGVDPAVPSTITAFPPGYINKDEEVRAA
jgi:hypothetical protein